MTTYHVTATREPGWWALVAVVDDREVASQCRRLDQADATIREAIALVLDVDEDTVDVDVEPRMPAAETLEAAARQVKHRRVEVDRQADQVTRDTATVVAQLRTETDLTVRDVAWLVGITSSRVSQLTATGETDTTKAHA